MKPSQRVYRLSSEAENIIQSRVGAPTSEGGPKQPSPSMVLNSIVLRYEALMTLNANDLHPKFTNEELAAIFKWVECQPSAHQSVVKLDSTSHIDSMVKLVVDGAEICGQNVLDTHKRKALIRIITNNLRPRELFSISDSIAKRLSKRAKVTG